MKDINNKKLIYKIQIGGLAILLMQYEFRHEAGKIPPMVSYKQEYEKQMEKKVMDLSRKKRK